MVMFFLTDRRNHVQMMMDMDDEDEVAEIYREVSGCWSCTGFLLRNGYAILRPEYHVGDCISEGDVVDVFPDPNALPSQY